jgi:hypothetical protein
MHRLKYVMVGGMAIWMTPLMCSGFIYSMRTGSALVRKDIVAAIIEIQSTSPADDQEWSDNVVAKTLALDKTLRTLSAGFGRGFFGIVLLCWSLGLGSFCHALNTPRAYILGPQDQPFHIVNVILMASCPLLLCLDVATTSQRCDDLMDELNQVRITSGERYHTRLEWLELSLKNLNRGQGLVRPSARQCALYPLPFVLHSSPI